MRELVREVRRLGGLDPDGLWSHRVRPLDVPLQVPPHRSGCRRQADPGDLRDACPVWLPPGPCPAGAGGLEINIKKVYRIYRELGLQLRNKTPKRRVKAKLRDDRVEAVGQNEVWAME